MPGTGGRAGDLLPPRTGRGCELSQRRDKDHCEATSATRTGLKGAKRGSPLTNWGQAGERRRQDQSFSIAMVEGLKGGKKRKGKGKSLVRDITSGPAGGLGLCSRMCK